MFLLQSLWVYGTDIEKAEKAEILKISNVYARQIARQMK